MDSFFESLERHLDVIRASLNVRERVATLCVSNRLADEVGVFADDGYLRPGNGRSLSVDDGADDAAIEKLRFGMARYEDKDSESESEKTKTRLYQSCVSSHSHLPVRSVECRALHPNDETGYKSWAVCSHLCGAVKNHSAS